MKTIYKYPLEVKTAQVIQMPEMAQPLCVQAQFDKPMMWALVDPSNKLEDRTFYTYGTGHEVTKEGLYLGTYQLASGGLIFHVFEEVD